MKSERQHKEDIVEVCRRMHQKGMIAASDGNVSVRYRSDRVIMTPSGLNKGFISVDDLVVVDMEGRKISGRHKPTSEVNMHIEAYKQRDDIGAAVHAHPPKVTGFSVAGVTLARCVLPEVVLTMGSIPTAPYATPTTQEGAEAIKELIRDYDAIVLDRHGSFSVGSDVFKAYNMLEKIEHAAEVTLVARQLGKVRDLPASEVAKLSSMAQKFGMKNPCVGCGACGSPKCSDSKPVEINAETESDEEKLVGTIVTEVRKALA